jgi:hypothetical protein
MLPYGICQGGINLNHCVPALHVVAGGRPTKKRSLEDTPESHKLTELIASCVKGNY